MTASRRSRNISTNPCQVWDRADVKREKKVVVLMELHRATIYTTKMSKQVTKSHVRDAVHMYDVNCGAGLTTLSGERIDTPPCPTSPASSYLIIQL